MLHRRHFLQNSLAATLSATGLAWHGLSAQEPGKSIVGAAEHFLDTLPTKIKTKVLFAYGDEERYLWDFVPLNDTSKRIATRKGISLEDCSNEALTAAMQLLQFSVGQQGFEWSKIIMGRESILAELEPRNAWFRKPGWYFITFFGKPSSRGVWGWRLDGHHLSVNCTIQDGELISTSPSFFGVNPVTIKHGARAGTRDCITA
ncbi:MAG TPA: DUF3500 domain-containing protein, partial [Gemmatales bacterium]|nr:DUF3500 domain-containing protein [Gemmatales bacterium]